MDIQKEWDLFVAHLRTLGVVKIGRNALGVITNLTREGNCSLGYNDIELMWKTWQVAKAQVVQEGFVVMPKLLSDELADELAIDAFNNIQSMFDYEHRGSTATHREEIRLRWCKNKARDFQENYKAMIEAQERSHDS
ncbi:hypothetical protein [Acinetobacter kyonggiensis]|uniref:Uncharacterized protein n=1 Tax=Acinetobacter kyonggiensis TaxID=595670 RepID=A0A1H3GS85_9GAMM|nr:hypothetical protein [Acinetobacter kyonggiensis]SDY06173.1 hypothetical protein SAMN05421643_10332 [Acinetobacter kyonggiensis]